MAIISEEMPAIHMNTSAMPENDSPLCRLANNFTALCILKLFCMTIGALWVLF